MSERFGRLIVRHRGLSLLLILLATVLLGWKIKDVRFTSETIDLFPKSHPYVETFVKYADVFGGANTAVLAVEVQRGDIFTYETLEKIRRVTRAVELLPGVNNYQVLSIAQRKVKNITAEFIGGGNVRFKAEPIMFPDVPRTGPEIDQLRETVRSDPRIFGTLVSSNSKAALVVAGFLENALDPAAIHAGLKKIVKAEEDANTRLYVIGRPVMLGHIMENYPQLVRLFVATLVSMALVLLLYFRNLRGVLMPLGTAALSAVWGLGFVGWLGHNFDPLVIVVPFIISARALSHSVQLIERFFEECQAGKERKEAAAVTFSGLMAPGLLAIITDAAGVFLVFLTPIPLMQKLALMGGFWVLSFIVSDLVFNTVLLSFLSPPPAKPPRVKATLSDRLLRVVSGWCLGRARWAVLGTTLVVGGVGFYFARYLVIGDVHPGTPMLWPDSKYNQDTLQIARTFANTEILSIIVQGKECPAPPRAELLERHGCDEAGGRCYDDAALSCRRDEDCFGCELKAGTCKTDRGRRCAKDLDCVARDCNPIKSPAVLQTMEFLQREMETLPEVGSSASMAAILPGVVASMHGGDPKWELIPKDRFGAGSLVEQIISKSEPGDLTRFMTPDYQRAAVTLYLKDHKGETLRRVIAKAKEFIAAHPLAEAEFLLASGYGGLLAAVNEVITTAEVKVTFLAFLMVFLCCAVTYRSIVAGLLFLVPLFLSNYVTYAVMGALGIGLDVNALPVVSLGVGLGVDYGLYVVSRIIEEYRVDPDLGRAIDRSIATAGKAVLFTATTMVVGIVFWAWSFLKFQADMGILLAVWMCVSMLGGLILVPTLIYTLKPRFITRTR
ncbi:MAG: MMPL family transporter [Deltaproteobacteria bacterium]|nr:MMPL family transporter [Deltaproteobacteria bacterium]